MLSECEYSNPTLPSFSIRGKIHGMFGGLLIFLVIAIQSISRDTEIQSTDESANVFDESLDATFYS